MAFSDYSATPSSNTTLAGLSVAENTTAMASVNNGLRQLMADGKLLSSDVAAIGNPLQKTGGEMTGAITRQGRGGHYTANSVSNTDPQIYILVDGSPAPSSPPNGSLVFYYAP